MKFSKLIEFSDHSGPVYSISPSHKFVYSSGGDKWVARWDISSLKQDAFAVKLQSAAFCIFHSKSFPLLYIGCSNGDFHIINTDNREEIKFIQHHKSAIFAIQDNPLKNHVYTGDSAGNLCIWDGSTFQIELQIPLNCNKIRAIELLDDGKKIVVISKDGKIRIFETTYFNEIQSLSINSDGIQSFLSIVDYSFVGGYDGYLYLVDLKNNSITSKIPAHKGAIYSIININDQYFATCSRDKTIKIWCVSTMNVIQKLDLKTGGHKNSVNSLILFGDKLLVSCSDDSRIIVWKIDEPKTTVIP